MTKRNIIRLVSLIVLLFALGLVFEVRAQTNRYARDGLSFTYPSEWPLSDESDATAQSLNLDRGSHEAKIMIVALRRQLNSEQLAAVQPKMIEAITSGLTQEIAKLGAQAERSSISETISGLTAHGVRLRATFKGETGDADIYWLCIGGRLVHVVFVGSEPERRRAAPAWNMIRATLRIWMPQVAPPAPAAMPD